MEFSDLMLKANLLFPDKFSPSISLSGFSCFNSDNVPGIAPNVFINPNKLPECAGAKSCGLTTTPEL